MAQQNQRGRKFIKQLPTRLRMNCPDTLNDLDEAVAALRHVAPDCAPPHYMLRDVLNAGARIGFRHNNRAYLRHLAMKAATTEGNVLECGSGISSLLLAITAGRRQLQVHSFEHNREQHQLLSGLVERYRLHNITVHHTPIISYGGFDWYDFPENLLCDNFQLVICDGPARHLTDSGRYGLFPCMRERLDPNCRVIMDDAHRKIDRRVIRRWRHEHTIEVQNFGRFMQFAEITCV